MRLFDDFEAVKFPEENLIFITHNGFLYYIYKPKYNFWRKHRHAGHDRLTVSNYQEISREELTEAMGGKFPEKETDFIRMCNPKRLKFSDLLALIEDDYELYMSDDSINCAVYSFLKQSGIPWKAYSELRQLFDLAVATNLSSEEALSRIKKLCLDFFGIDIFKKEICIVDGHDSSSYYWIVPARIVDYSDVSPLGSVLYMMSSEISIEENDVIDYLMPFLYKYFDDELEANKKRIKDSWKDDNGIEHTTYINGFEWNLEDNFYSYESMFNMLKDMTDTIKVMSSGAQNEFTAKFDTDEYELIIDFYRRFIYRMEYMIKVGSEKGYNLISFMGP